MKITPPPARRASVRTKSSRWSCAPRSARPRDSTTRHARPSKLRPRRMSMRLAILDSGHGFGAKVLFALIRAFSRQPVLDVIKLVKYRADFYGGALRTGTPL